MRAFRILDGKKQVPIIAITNGHEPILATYPNCDMEHVLHNFVEKVRSNKIKVQKCISFNIYNDKTKQLMANFSS